MHDCPKKMQYITSLLLPECRSEELHFPQPFGLVVVIAAYIPSQGKGEQILITDINKRSAF